MRSFHATYDRETKVFVLPADSKKIGRKCRMVISFPANISLPDMQRITAHASATHAICSTTANPPHSQFDYDKYTVRITSKCWKRKGKRLIGTSIIKKSSKHTKRSAKLVDSSLDY